MHDLPSGNLIVLCTDIEGSTALRERNRQAMAVAESHTSMVGARWSLRAAEHPLGSHNLLKALRATTGG